jgi:hypothetical protein
VTYFDFISLVNPGDNIGRLLFYSTYQLLLMHLFIDIDEASPSEDEDIAQRALHGQHVNHQNMV